ncbi:unnamed protein product, partial [Chrysoparadoxa australica]
LVGPGGGFISGEDTKKLMTVCMTLCNEVRRVEGIIWHLKKLCIPREGTRITPIKTLSFKANRTLVGASLPDSLLEIALGDSFYEPLAGVLLPGSLQKLTFGRCLNQPLFD